MLGWCLASLVSVVAAAYASLLLIMHRALPTAETLRRPLSEFRDGSAASLAAAVFTCLGLVGALHLAQLVRTGRLGQAFICTVACGLFTYVALTPSDDTAHLLASLVLLSLVYTHFALLLRWQGSGWLFIHLAVPVALLTLLGVGGYGLWQKSVITYFVTLLVIQAWLLGAEEGQGFVRRERTPVRRKRRVWVLEDDEAWRRTPGRASAGSA
ncbi:MAG TPA: hypothetical protein PKD86_09835 [Gemmatales bacterium]|nr:hypothetical protein [Gemmatales bacterium]HMP59642.1 hypothetical protein [Gemmatales bacterium]